MYCIIGLNRQGIKDLLGLYIGEAEGARFWLNVLTDLQNRGVQDMLIVCIDNLKGFAEAIESIFPKSEVQLCVIHQIRQSTHYVSFKDRREVMRSLKNIYQAPTLEQAEAALVDTPIAPRRLYPTYCFRVSLILRYSVLEAAMRGGRLHSHRDKALPLRPAGTLFLSMKRSISFL